MKTDSRGARSLVEPARAEGAFLAAAIGDALGWPQEARARRSGGANHNSIRFDCWKKRSGGRFMPHEERISAGEYSDDTQLIIASARSLLSAERWWEHFAFVELPFWTTYERGGGGATRRSAKQLVAGNLPWEAKRTDDLKRYFEAGGNGVAMRILPHCLIKSSCDDFRELAVGVVTDGVCSHGHPRALVGALAYAYGLWAAFRHRGTLEYGALLRWTLDGIDSWSSLPEIADRWPTWRHSAERTVPNYSALWRQAADETRDLLEVAIEGLSGGALSLDEQTLEALGCFDAKINGAGTIAAAASLFLASRHAVDPDEGIRRAALASGADTDTIASMTGALLGAITGSSWLTEFQPLVQDERFLRHLALAVTPRDIESMQVARVPSVQKGDIAAFFKTMHTSSQGASVVLPNGLSAVTYSWDGITSTSKSLDVSAWRVITADGQTLFLKELAKRYDSGTRTDLFQESLLDENKGVATRLGLTITVSDLEQSRRFYEKALGVQVWKTTPKSINFGGVLAVRVGPRSGAKDEDVSLFVEVADIDDCYRRVAALHSDILAAPSHRSGRAFFICRDPDQYVVEIYQHQ